MKKNVILRILAAVQCTLCLLAMFLVNAFAYLDPSVLTYAVSAVAGVLVVCGGAFYVIFRKVKKKAAKVLHIDENANKEVEADVEISDEE